MASDEAAPSPHRHRATVPVPLCFRVPGAEGAIYRGEPSDANALWSCRLEAIHHEAVEEQLQAFQVPLLPLGGCRITLQAAAFLDVDLLWLPKPVDTCFPSRSLLRLSNNLSVLCNIHV